MMMMRRRWPVSAVAVGAVVAVVLCGTPARSAGLNDSNADRSESAAASSSALMPAVSTPIAGIETAGPIPTVTGRGDLIPALPPTLAKVPGGVALHGNYPWIYVKDLDDAKGPAVVDVRVYDATEGRGFDVKQSSADYVWQGTLDRGWGQIGAVLTAGHGYVVWALDPSSGIANTWVDMGRFGVTGKYEPAGPSTSVGGMSASAASGELAWSWESEQLAGPSEGSGLAMSWQARQPASAGLPAGWSLAAASGSPWESISEEGDAFKALTTPAPPIATTTGTNKAHVSFTYDVKRRLLPKKFLIEERVGRRWTVVKRIDPTRRTGVVTALIDVLKNADAVRLAVATADAILYSSPRAFNFVPKAAKTPQPEQMSADCGSAYSNAAGPRSVKLTGWNGTSMTFLRNALGVYEQAYGGDRVPGYSNTLSLCLSPTGKRSWLFTDASGTVTRFENGRVRYVMDQDKPVSTLTWSGDRLISLANAVDRTLTLTYAGSGDCPTWSGFATTPTGMLCRINYPGGVSTDIGYVSDGLKSPQIALIKDPGNRGTAFGWDSVGRLVATRNTLANRAATTDASAKNALASVTYDNQGRVSSVSETPAAPGAAVVTQRLILPVIAPSDLKSGTDVPAEIRGTATGFGMSNKVVLDPVTLRVRRSTDAAGMTTSSGTDGQKRTTTDARGMVTTYTYDDYGNLVSESGPVLPGTANQGTTVNATYDTTRKNGEDEAYEGFRATVYSAEGFAGTATSQYWKPQDGNGLAARWTGAKKPMSAIAEALWTPTKAQDDAAKDVGWTFTVDSPQGSNVRLIVEGIPCDGPTCTFRQLPSGTKQVTVEISRGSSDGWFAINAGIGSARPAPVETSQVVPGFANRTRVVSNDTYINSEVVPATDYVFEKPESGQITAADMPGGYRATMTYEPSNPDQGQWGRLLTYTTPGGKVISTQYWPNSGTVPLPDVCGGTAVLSGQPKRTIRQDGSKVTSYFDVRGRIVASVTEGATAGSQTVCTDFYDDGSLRRSASYASDGRLIEQVDNIVGVNGDPLTSQQTVTHGPAAPIDANASFTSTTTTDLRGYPVRYVDESGTTTVTTYNALSDPVTVAVTAPGANSPVLTFGYTYRSSDGAPTAISVNGVSAATVTYEKNSASVKTVSYANSAAQSSLTYAANGRPASLITMSGTNRYTHRLEYNDYGRILNSRLNVQSNSTTAYVETRGYTYDAAGRLTRALMVTTPGASPAVRTSYEYAYAAAQAASCGATGYAKASADALRTGGKRGDVPYTTCHDAGGRIDSTTDPVVTGDVTGQTKSTLAYDGLGRVTSISGGERPVALTWGSGTSLAKVREGSGTNNITTTLSTFAGRTVDKTVTTSAGTDALRYSYATASAGSPLMLLDNSGSSLSVRSVSYPLPGGARVDVPVGGVPTLSVSGIDGSAMATFAVPALAVTGVSGSTAATGLGVAVRFGPYGEPLVAPSATPAANAAPDYTWQAAIRKETLLGTSSITLLGARPYHAGLGEFLAPDSQLLGATNMYSFTPGDPINGTDRTGQANEWSWFWQVVTAVLVVATIAADIASFGVATPATGAGLGAWFGYLAVTIAAPMALSFLAGKALEQSIKCQTEPSPGLDVFRSVLGWAQMITNVGMFGVTVVQGGAWLVKKVATWWRSSRAARAAANGGRDLAAELSGLALNGPRRSVALPSTSRLTFGSLSNGSRNTLTTDLGSLSFDFDMISFSSLRSSNRSSTGSFAMVGLD